VSKPVNKTVLGGFVVAAIGLFVAAILVFGSGQFFKKTELRVMYFDGSVKGLDVGAPVLFRGVKVGQVKKISLHWDVAKKDLDIPVIVEYEPDAFTLVGGVFEIADRAKNHRELLEKGLRAQLGTQSFVTGQLLINVDFFPGTPFTLDPDAPYLEIPTIPTTLQKLEKALEDLPLKEMVANLNSAIQSVDKLVNSPELKESVTHLNATLKEARDLVANVNAQVKPLSAGVSETLRDAQKLMRNADSQVASLGPNLDGAIGDARKLIKNVDGSVDDLRVGLVDMIKNANEAVKKAEMVLEGLESSARSDSALMYHITEALNEIAKTARSLRALTDYLEMHPEALLSGKGEPGGN
jgi:phospholipid/cholesterol/gamma-HCH transport system substrate-binding protein